MALPGGFDFERVIEAIEVVESAGDCRNLDDFAFGEVFLEHGEFLICDVVRVKREFLGKYECGALAHTKDIQFTLLESSKLSLSCPQPPCQGSMRIESIIAMIDMGDAHRDEFLQLFLYRARAHHGSEMRCERPHDFGAMGRGAEHIGYISALLQEGIEDFTRLRVDLVGREFGHTRHGRIDFLEPNLRYHNETN